MVYSPLIEPLVRPLVGGGASGRRARTRLGGSRMVATALIASALMAATMPSEAERTESEPTMSRNVHAVPVRSVEAASPVATPARRADRLVQALRQAPDFDDAALAFAKLRQALDQNGENLTALGSARRRDRLLSSMGLSFLNFGSARVLAAQPHS